MGLGFGFGLGNKILTKRGKYVHSLHLPVTFGVDMYLLFGEVIHKFLLVLQVYL